MRSASPSSFSLLPRPQAHAVSKNVQPSAIARPRACSDSWSSDPVQPAIPHMPQPMSETCQPVRPKVRYRIYNLPMITREIIGDDMQAAVLLGSGDEIRAEAGAMTYMTDGIEMDARMPGGSLGGRQTLPFSRLAERIHAAYRGDNEEVKRDLGCALAAIGDLIGGDS